MSQPDLLAELRDARPLAPAELREHVRRITAEAAPGPRRQLTWRRGLVLAAAAAVAVAGAGAAIVLHGSGGGSQPNAVEIVPPLERTAAHGSVAAAAPGAFARAGAGTATALPAPSPNRVQRISTSLELRVANAQAVSSATKKAVAVARSLGGYPSRLNVDAAGRTGYATVVLRIPKEHLQQAVTRLSALGTIVGENVSLQDLQAQVDASAGKLKRLEARLAYWQAQPQTDQAQKQVASFEAAIAKLERSRNATIRSASYATLTLQLTSRAAPTPLAVHKGHGPLHGLGIALRWLGIGAIYAVALGGPVVAVVALLWLAARGVRRRREEALLSRS